MKTKLIMGSLFALLLVMLTAGTASGQAYTGVVTVDSVEAQRGEQASVPIRLKDNNKPISGLVVPLRYPSSKLHIDSVSFEGSLITSDFMGGVNLVEDPNIVKISYLLTNYSLPIPSIAASNGVIATIHFTVQNNAGPESIELDSVYDLTFIPIGNNDTITIETSVQATDPSGLITYHPEFVPGLVKVLVPTAVGDDDGSALPTDFGLAQNYPNPFNPATTIGFALPKASHVKLEVFNVLGQKVTTLIDQNYPAGNHQIQYDASASPSGVYFYRLTHIQGVETRKMILVK